jgi:transcriptional regulator with XRE-family HTH domain
MKDRLLKLIRQYNLTSSRFADELGVQRSGISHILSGRNQPSFDFLVKLLSKYTEISPDWLIMGSGTMFRASLKEKINPEPGLFDPVDVGNSDDRQIHAPAKPENSQNIKVTNVTPIQQIVIFYPDGTFTPYLPVSKD